MYRAARITLGGVLAALVSLLCIAGPAQASGPGYYYAGATESGLTGVTGINAKIWIGNPYRQANSGEHTLAELVLHDTVTNSTVEWGWIKDGSGAGGPRLFVYYWVTGTPVNCYYGCGGWHDNASNPIDIGADLTSVAAGCNGSTTLNCVKPFQIQYSSTPCSIAPHGWYFYYDGVNVGCLQSNAVGGGFTAANETQAFGEVYYGGSTVPCTDMGNGKYATATATAGGSAFFASISYLGTAASPNLTLATSVPQYDPGAYTVSSVGSPGNRTFTFGGAGRTSSGGTPGNTGSC